MRARKLAALLCACAVVSSVLPAALASGGETGDHIDNVSSTAVPELSRVDEHESRAVGEAAADAGAAAATELDSTLTKVIVAPFRGLARLFGGGKKDSQAAKDDAVKDYAAKDDAARPGGAAATAASPSNPRDASATAAPDYAPAARPLDAPFMPLVVGVPNDPISQGRALIARGLFEEAISELSVAAATGTNLVEANNLLGLTYDHRGEHARAREFYERALMAAPHDARVLNNLGYSLYLDDRPKEAVAKLKSALSADPSSAEAYNNLGFAYARLNKYDEAFRSFTQAGGDLYARLRTAMLLEDAGRDRDAIKHYEAARKLDPASTDLLRRLITLYNRTGQREKAETVERSLDKQKTKSASSTTD